MKILSTVGAPFALAFLLPLQTDHPTLMSDVAVFVEWTDSGTEGDGTDDSKSFAYSAEFAGTLYLWAASGEVRASLRLESPEGEVLAERDGAGGARSPFLTAEVTPGQSLRVTVTRLDSDRLGTLELHATSAPESAATRDAGRSTRAAIERATKLEAESLHAEAREELSRALDELGAVPGAETSGIVAIAYREIAELALNLRASSSQFEACKRMSAHFVRCYPPDHAERLEVANNLAVSLHATRQLAAAKSLLAESLAIQQALINPDEGEILVTKFNLGGVYLELGEWDAAYEVLLDVHEARRRSLTLHDPDLLASKTNLALTMSNLGRHSEALEVQREVLNAYSELLQEEDLTLLVAKGNYAATCSELGQYEKARDLKREVLEVRTRIQDPEHHDVLLARHNLAVTLLRMDDYYGARLHQEAVLEVWTRVSARDDPNLLLAMNNAALTRFALGDVQGALDLQHEVLERQSARLPSDHALVLKALNNLALTQMALWELDEAIAIQEEVVTGFSNSASAGYGDLLVAKENLAFMRALVDDFDGALKLMEETLAARSAWLGPAHPDLLTLKDSMATVLWAGGDVVGAIELFEEVLEFRLDHYGPAHPGSLGTLGGLAVAQSRLDDDEAARETLRTLLAYLRERAALLRMEAPRDARDGVRAEMYRMTLALMLSETLGADAELARDLVESLECLRQASIYSPDVALALADRPELAELQQAIAAVKTELHDHRVLSPREGASVAEWTHRLRELAARRDRLQRELRAALFEGEEPSPPVDAAGVASRLPADGLAISYLRIPTRFTRGPDRLTIQPHHSLAACLIRPDGSVELLRLGELAGLEEEVMLWRQAIGRAIETRGAAGPGGLSSGADIHGERIRARILDPILERVPSARTLHIVPDDFLYLVPIDALPLGNDRVGDVYRIRIEVSLARLSQSRRPHPASTGLLVVGGIDYGAGVQNQAAAGPGPSTPPARPVHGAGTRGRPPKKLAPIAGAEEEISWIGARYLTRFTDGLHELRGTGATKRAIARAVPGIRYLHVVTHGWFENQAFESLLDGKDLDAAHYQLLLRAERAIQGLAPETLCGLALAGYNRGVDALGRMPGVLTAEELSMFDLGGCELAVLSGCETNVGVREAGLGIQSLQNALHGAGVRTAITSLWTVPDDSSTLLMTEFYTNLWERGMTKAEALWEAKRELRDRNFGLHAWAGWVLTGEHE